MVTTVLLLLFTGLVIWHSNPPQSDHSQIQQEQQLIQTYPELNNFLKRGSFEKGSHAFYSIGLPGKQAWPTSVIRACYKDPLAARWQCAFTRDAYSDKLELIRYRSRTDFMALLLASEQESTGYIKDLDLRSHTHVLENPFSVSLRSLLGILTGLLVLLVVRRVQKYR